MENLFIPYEIALQLKQKGFNEECLACFTSKTTDSNFNQFWFSEQIWENSDLHPNPRICKNSDFGNEKSCTAPLYQQVVDFFRDKHSIYIAVLPFRDNIDGTELCWYYSLVQDDEDLTDILCNEDDLGAHGDNYPTPKEAYDGAFLEALKLI